MTSPHSTSSHPRLISRRSLLQSLAAGVAPLVVAPRVLGRDDSTAPSNRLTLGMIGVGTHGLGYNLPAFLNLSDAQVVAVCDVFTTRRETAQAAVQKQSGQNACRTYGDFRELLAASDIDAVCISTPDHWHVPMSLLALEAGKDVMCEKPTLTIAEGRALARAVAKHNKVYQVGLEDRSVPCYHRMAELVRNGAIGTLHSIYVQLPAGQAFPKEDPAPVPAGFDWNLWLGPAPFHPYSPSRTGPQQWRNIRDYGGGKFADWGSHLLDTAQVANLAERSGPIEVSGQGAVPPNSMTTMPITYQLHYRYANGVDLFVKSGGISLRFEGTDGWIENTGWRGPVKASSPEVLNRSFPDSTNRLWPIPASEHRNFLDCIRSRHPTTYTAEDGHRLSTLMHIGNLSIELGRKLAWDPHGEAFLNDDEANHRRSRPARDWKA